MEYIVNQGNIQKYAERLTHDLCRQFFVNKAFISGPEILTFNSETALNLLLVKNIFLNWQKEALKLKSPYFDYEDPEVRQSLKAFMDKLSNHIKVYRYDFEPLVTRSISDLILLAAAPQDFFTKETEGLASPKVPVSLLKEFSKYIRVNRFVMEQVVREIEASGYTETFAGETIRFILKAINENPDKLEIPEVALKGLLEQLPAEVTEFVCVPKPLVTRPSFLDKPRAEEPEAASPPPVAEPLEKAGQFPVADPVREEIPVAESTPAPAEPEAVADIPEPEPFQAEPVPVGQVEASEEAEPVVFSAPLPDPEPAPVRYTQSAEPTGPDREPLTLNEVLRKTESSKSLAESLQVKSASAPFKTLVPMHYRFTFINALFAGNQQAWAEAVEKIDSAGSYEEAIALLKAQYSADYKWDQEEDNVAILFNYVERKF